MDTRNLIALFAAASAVSCEAVEPPHDASLPPPTGSAAVTALPSPTCRDELTVLFMTPPTGGRTGVTCPHPRHRLEVDSTAARVLAMCVCTEEPKPPVPDEWQDVEDPETPPGPRSEPLPKKPH